MLEFIKKEILNMRFSGSESESGPEPESESKSVPESKSERILNQN